MARYLLMAARDEVTGISVETYFNPTLPNNYGWMASDDAGHYGWARTPLDAIRLMLDDEADVKRYGWARTPRKML